MRLKKFLPIIVTFTSMLGPVYATSFVMSTDALVSLSMSSTKGTSSSFRDDKIVLDAKEDAESFVASDGQFRGAHLESALMHIRERLADQAYSDMQLAVAIISL